MGLTRIAAVVALRGVALVIVGATVLAGAWALVAAGVVLVALGLVVDWEKAS
jgi:hypothetical protein